MKKPHQKDMIERRVAATLAGVAVLAGQLASPVKASADAIPDMPQAWQKCYGVAKAGMNNCSSLDGRHTCAGGATVDNDPTEYVWMPAGTCKRIVGATVGERKLVPKRVLRAIERVTAQGKKD